MAINAPPPPNYSDEWTKTWMSEGGEREGGGSIVWTVNGEHLSMCLQVCGVSMLSAKAFWVEGKPARVLHAWFYCSSSCQMAGCWRKERHKVIQAFFAHIYLHIPSEVPAAQQKGQQLKWLWFTQEFINQIFCLWAKSAASGVTDFL